MSWPGQTPSEEEKQAVIDLIKAELAVPLLRLCALTIRIAPQSQWISAWEFRGTNSTILRRSTIENLFAPPLALSLAVAPGMKAKGRYELVPPVDYPPIEQAAVVIKASKKKDTAKQFLDYIKKPEIVSLMRDYGFVIPDSTPAAAN